MVRLLSLFSSLSLFLGTVNSLSYTPCSLCLERASPQLLDTISLRVYNNGTMKNYSSVLIQNSVDILEEIDMSKPIVLYCSGWSETPEAESITTVLGAYIERQDHTVIQVDYYQIAKESYPFALLSVSGVCYTLARAIDRLVEAGLNSSRLHIVGHSLGAQIAACVGRNVSCEVETITALDPAGPGFDQIGKTLSPKDAKCVIVISTDAGVYGSGMSQGHINFWPNGGTRVQPGCPARTVLLSAADYCSHHRSWRYFAESVRNEGSLIGIKCDSWYSFQLGECESNEKVAMGLLPTSCSATGNYYLQTHSESPFGRGKAGTNYERKGFSFSSILSSALNLFSVGR